MGFDTGETAFIYSFTMQLKKERKPGSGRKKIDYAIRKTGVTVFLENRVIDGLGGSNRVKLAFIDFITSIYNSMNNDKTKPINHQSNSNGNLS
jgi:hypothetical protein